MKFTSLIQKTRTCLLTGTTKKDALDQLIELIGQTSPVQDINALREAIFYRERLMSTGIGLGIGIPHIRSTLTEEPLLAVGISPNGLKDYESIDGTPVHIIVMIITGRAQHKQHIRILSDIVSFFKQPEVREKLISAKTVDDILKALPVK